MRYWAAGPLEDVDNWVWWNEGRGEAVAVGLPRPSAVIPSDLNCQHAADITTAGAKERTNYVSRNCKINK